MLLTCPSTRLRIFSGLHLVSGWRVKQPSPVDGVAKVVTGNGFRLPASGFRLPPLRAGVLSPDKIRVRRICVKIRID
jgi:hypothetical protein